MFFSISDKKDMRFINHEVFGDFVVSFDNGWQKTNETTLFKGYRTPNIDHGNWCEITLNEKNNIFVDHDKNRSFPLWWDENNKILTNLLGTGDSIWADKKVILNEDLEVEFLSHDPIGEINFSKISLDKFNHWIVEDLMTKSKDIVSIYSDFRFFYFNSSGVDTGLISALVYNQKLPATQIVEEYFEVDKFCLMNINEIQNSHWSYKQIHHWKSPCFLMTGGCGDEFWFRGPYLIGLWAAWHDINVIDLLKRSSGYHVGYFLKEKNKKIFKELFLKRHEIKERYPKYEDLILQILNVNVNDHQHWHLGNTITWTPYKDIEITKNILRLPFDILIDQIVKAKVNFGVIDLVCPEISHKILKTKNQS